MGYIDTNLYNAVKSGDLDKVKYTIESCVDLNGRNFRGCTILMLACYEGHPEIVKFFLDKFSTLKDSDRPNVRDADYEGVTVLMKASQGGNADVVKLILDDSDVNAKDSTDQTALMFASRRDHTSVISLLLDKSHVDATNIYGDTALDIASQCGHFDAVKLLSTKGNLNSENMYGETSLIHSCNFGNISVTQLLIDEGGDLDTQTKSGKTALMSACYRGYISTARLLIDKGASLNVQDKKGRTALMHGAHHNEITHLLLEYKANTALLDSEGIAALTLVCVLGSPYTVKLLLDATETSIVEVKDCNGFSTLNYTIRNERLDIVRLLLTRVSVTEFDRVFCYKHGTLKLIAALS